MSRVESVAVFKEKLDKMRLSKFWPKMEALGWDTLGNYAFAGNSNPANLGDAAMFQEKIMKKLSDDPQDPKAAPT